MFYVSNSPMTPPIGVRKSRDRVPLPNTVTMVSVAVEIIVTVFGSGSRSRDLRTPM
jgi:hypothetical protein